MKKNPGRKERRAGAKRQKHIDHMKAISKPDSKWNKS